MTFRDPTLFYVLLVLPLLAAAMFVASRRRKAFTARMGDPALVTALVASRSPWLRATRGVLSVVGLGAAIVAVAGPQWGSRTRTLSQRGVDVVVVLDFSKSMLARDVRPNRLERAKTEIRRMLGMLGGDRVGLVAFAGETLEFPMTTDYPALEIFLRDIGPYDMPVGGTAIGRALVAAGRLLERSRAAERPGTDGRPRAAQVVVLITDGEDHEGDPVAAARQLSEKGVVIHVLGVGSRTGESIPTFAPDGTQTGYLRDEQGQLVTSALTDENETQLRSIAEAGHGRYHRAAQGSASLDPIRRDILRMEAEERRVRRVTVKEDRFAIPLLIAFLLLVLEGVLPEGALARARREVKP